MSSLLYILTSFMHTYFKPRGYLLWSQQVRRQLLRRRPRLRHGQLPFRGRLLLPAHGSGHGGGALRRLVISYYQVHTHNFFAHTNRHANEVTQVPRSPMILISSNCGCPTTVHRAAVTRIPKVRLTYDEIVKMSPGRARTHDPAATLSKLQPNLGIQVTAARCSCACL